MKTVTIRCFTILIALSMHIIPVAFAEPCPTFHLKTDEGKIINPLTGENADKPYSTRQTCGSCHDYETIASAYHFDMDWSFADDSKYADTNEPWKFSSGMTGSFCTVPYRQIAKKRNTHPDQIDITPFMFAASGPQEPELLGKPGCGGCHPGGGMLEVDRDGNRYDKHLKENPSLAASLDGDYYKSKWDKTGVLEVDCFFCHLPSYSFKTRNKQLKYLNFKWSSVAASGIGQVLGKVKEGKEPKVVYNKRLFNEDGRIALPMERDGSAENCLLCHDVIDMAKRGTSWEDSKNEDVHQLGGLTCNDCHPAGLDHNFAKGDIARSSVRDDLDNSMRTCEDCHTTSYKGAPQLKHYSLREDHLEKLSCAACHIPELNRSAMGAMIMTTGPAVKYPQINSGAIGENVVWKPAYQIRKKVKDKTAKIHPVNPLISILFTNKDTDGKYHPLFVREVTKAYNSVQDKLSNKDTNKYNFHTSDDISLMLSTLSKTLIDNQRFQKIDIHFHSGGTLYSLDENGSLVQSEDATWVAEIPPFSISHNVAPINKALGANGCTDCHSDESHMFSGTIVKDPFGLGGKPVTIRSGEMLGFDSATFKLNFFFQYYLTRILPTLIIVLVILVGVLTFRYMGQKSRGSLQTDDTSSELGRLGRSEFWTAIFRVVVLLFLVCVAHLLIFADVGMIGLFASIYKKTVVYAGIMGIVIFLCAAIAYIMLIKLRGNIFEEKNRGFLWAANILALIMASTGSLLLIKSQLSTSANLFLSSFHGVVAIIFLCVVAIYTYLVISHSLKKRAGKRA